jgi:hypothetical protein
MAAVSEPSAADAPAQESEAEESQAQESQAADAELAGAQPDAQLGAATEAVPDAVSRVRAELAALSELDLNQHPDVYRRIHTELQDTLAGIDDA